VSIPESASKHVNVTSTSELYQPLLSGPRSGVAVIVGLASSIFTVAVSVVELPALSNAVPVTE
jgi:hypothetical protein